MMDRPGMDAPGKYHILMETIVAPTVPDHDRSPARNLPAPVASGRIVRAANRSTLYLDSEAI